LGLKGLKKKKILFKQRKPVSTEHIGINFEKIDADKSKSNTSKKAGVNTIDNFSFAL
jgi:hypothetical protein